MNGLTTTTTSGSITVRGNNAILITDIDGKLQVYINCILVLTRTFS